MAEEHAEVGSPLGYGAEVAGVGHQLGEGDEGGYELGVPRVLYGLYLAPPGAYVPDHVPHVLLRHGYLKPHYRLKEDGFAPLEGVPKGEGSRPLEGQLGGVHLVVGAVYQLHLYIHHGEAGQDPLLHGLLYPLIHGRYELPRYPAAHYLIHELVALAPLKGIDVYDDVAVLPTAARLTDELALNVMDGYLYGLTVGHPRLARLNVKLEVPPDEVHLDVQVQLPHPRDDGLARLLIHVEAEGGVLLGELGEDVRELLLVLLALREYGLGYDGFGYLKALKDEGMLNVGYGVSGAHHL